MSAKCNTLTKFLNKYLKKLRSTELGKGGKPLRFVANKITATMVSNALDMSKSFDDIFGKQEFPNVLFQKLKAIRTTLKNLKDNNNGKLSDYAIEPKDDEAIRKNIALNFIIDSISSETNRIEKNINKDNSVNKFIIHSGKVETLGVPVNQVSQAIGRAILGSKGLVIKADKNIAETNKYYSEIGKKYIDKLVKEGFVQKAKADIVKDFYTEEEVEAGGSELYKEKIGKTMKNQEVVHIDFRNERLKALSDNDKTKLNDIILNNGAKSINNFNKKSELNIDGINTFLQVPRAVVTLKVPTTIAIPSTVKPEGALQFKQDNVKASPMLQETKKNLSEKSPMQIKQSGGILTFFKELSEAFNESDKPIQTFLRDLVADGEKGMSQEVLTVFGLDDSTTKSFLSDDSVKGKNISKTSSLRDFLVSFNKFVDSKGDPVKLFYTLFSGRNVRLYIEQTVLNHQTDKLAKDIMTFDKYSIPKGSNAEKIWITHLADNSGFDYEDLMPKNISNLERNNVKIIKKGLKYLEDFKNGGDLQEKIIAIHGINDLMKGEKVSVKSQSFMHNLVQFQAIKDLKDSYATDNDIETEYNPNPDASALGATTILEQALKYTSKYKESSLYGILKQIGLIEPNSMTDKEKENRVNDIYSYVFDKIIVPLAEKGSMKDKLKNNTNSNKGEEVSESSLLSKMLATNIFKNGRDLAKLPVTTLIYGQGLKSSKETIAQEIATNMGFTSLTHMKTEEFQTFLKALGEESCIDLKIDKNQNSLTSENINLIKQALTNTIAKNIADKMNKDFNDKTLKEYNEAKDKTWDSLVKSFKALNKTSLNVVNEINERLDNIYNSKEANGYRHRIFTYKENVRQIQMRIDKKQKMLDEADARSKKEGNDSYNNSEEIATARKVLNKAYNDRGPAIKALSDEKSKLNDYYSHEKVPQYKQLRENFQKLSTTEPMILPATYNLSPDQKLDDAIRFESVKILKGNHNVVYLMRLAEYGMPLTKAENVMLKDGTMIKKDFPAKTVWNVSTNHALETYSMSKAVNEMARQNNFNGASQVYDSITANANNIETGIEAYGESHEDIIEKYSHIGSANEAISHIEELTGESFNKVKQTVDSSKLFNEENHKPDKIFGENFKDNPTPNRDEYVEPIEDKKQQSSGSKSVKLDDEGLKAEMKDISDNALIYDTETTADGKIIQIATSKKVNGKLENQTMWLTNNEGKALYSKKEYYSGIKDGKLKNINSEEEWNNKYMSYEDYVHNVKNAKPSEKVTTEQAIKIMKDKVDNSEQIAGFNNSTFDNKKIEEQLGIKIDSSKNKDIRSILTKYKIQNNKNGNDGSEKYNSGTQEDYLNRLGLPNLKTAGHNAEGDVYSLRSIVDHLANKIYPNPEDYKNGYVQTGTKDTIINRLKSLTTESDIISNFLIKNQNFTFKYGNDSQYNSKYDNINIEHSLSDKEMRTKVEHEIIHANTVAYIQSEVSKKEPISSIKYVQKAVKHIKDNLNSFPYRIQEIFANSGDATQMSEFVSIMKSEPKVAKDVYEAIDNDMPKTFRDKLSRAIDFIVTKVSNILTKEKSINKKLNKDLNVKTLSKSIENILINGESFRDVQSKAYKQAVKELNGQVFYFGSKGPNIVNSGLIQGTLDRLNNATYNVIFDKLDTHGTSFFKNIDNALLTKRYPAYIHARQAYNDVYNSEPMQKLFHYMDVADFKSKGTKNFLLSQAQKIENDKKTMINESLIEANKYINKLDKITKTDMNYMIQELPLTGLFLSGKTYDSVDSINQRIKELEGTFSNHTIKSIDSTVKMHTEAVRDNSSIYDFSKQFNNEQNYRDARELLGLKSLIASRKADSFIKIYNEHNELHTMLKDNYIVLDIMNDKIKGDRTHGDKHVKDYYNNQNQLKIISKKDMRKYESEKNGWKVLKEPTSKRAGVIYRPILNDSKSNGLRLNSDIAEIHYSVPSHIAEQYGSDNSIIKDEDGNYNLLLTHDQKVKLGLVQDGFSSLVRTTASAFMADEMNVVFNTLTAKSLTKNIDLKDNSLNELSDLIKSKTEEHPYFLKLNDNTNLSDIKDPKIQALIKNKYKLIDTRLSNIHGFKDKVTYVRKDITPWLTGEVSKSHLRNRTYQRIARTFKQLVSLAKLKFISNPRKLMKDVVSNDTFLQMKGVPARSILFEQNKIFKEAASYDQLKTELLSLRIKVLNGNKSAINRTNILQAKLEAHPLRIAYENGFSNSLSSDIVSNNTDTMSGLQADMKKVFDFMLTDKNGDYNALNDSIKKIANWGFDGEKVFSAIGKRMKEYKSTEEIGKFLNGVQERISEAKTKESMEEYLTNFTMSPASELVKASIDMNDLVDLTARETLRRHYVNNLHMDPREAVIKVIDDFPDYKAEMPMEMKVLSDFGIMMFPAYWARMINVNRRLVLQRSASTATELELVHLLDEYNIAPDTVFEHNILERLYNNATGTFGPTVISNPLDVISPNVTIF